MPLSNQPWCTQRWFDQTGYCFRALKSIWIFILLNFSKWIHFLDSIWLHILGCWFVEEMIKLLGHYCCIEVFKKPIEKFASCLLKFRIYEEWLTWTQFLFETRIIIIVVDTVRINICCPDKKSMQTVLFKNSHCVKAKEFILFAKSWQLIVKSGNGTSRLLPKRYLNSFAGCWKIGTINTVGVTIETSFPVTSKKPSCCLSSTFFTRNYSVWVEGRHIIDKNSSVYSQNKGEDLSTLIVAMKEKHFQKIVASSAWYFLLSMGRPWEKKQTTKRINNHKRTFFHLKRWLFIFKTLIKVKTVCLRILSKWKKFPW